MRRYWWVLATLAAAMVSAASSHAQERWRLFRDRSAPSAPCVPCPPAVETPAQPIDPNAPRPPADQMNQAPNSAFNEALASAGEGGTQPAAGYAPGFFGDLLAGCAFTTVAVREPNFGTFGGTSLQDRNICSFDVALSSGIKIAETDSPRPIDRIYYDYNFYGNVMTSPDPTVPLMDVHRHMLGFEKTLFGGMASIGMRLPFFSLGGDPTYDNGFAGDLSIITKVVIASNDRTGSLISGGLVITAPTGGSPAYLNINGGRTDTPRNYPVLIQPYVGYIWSPFQRLYFHGFHSVIVPTDSSEPTFMANDVGLGFWLYRNSADQFIRGIVPTIEIHTNTPFNHTAVPTALGQEMMLDSVNLSSGFYVMLPRSVIGCAVGVPLAYGPQTIEVIASYTLRF